MKTNKILNVLFSVLFLAALSGCVDPKLNANADVKTDIKTEVESLVKAHMESLIKTEFDSKIDSKIDNKMSLVGGNLEQKLSAQIKSDIQANTQNTGMFSGGAIYITVVAIVIIFTVFGTFLWLVKKLMQWKQIWKIVSESIEHQSTNNNEAAKEIKRDFARLSNIAGLQSVVNSDLQKRGFINKSKS